MKQAFLSLWKETSKKGNSYFKGKINNTKVVAFYVKAENPKAPSLTVYRADDENKEELFSMWLKTAKSGTRYLNGKYNNIWYVGFIDKAANAENKRPYIRIYEQTNDELPKPEQTKPERTKPRKAVKSKKENDGDLPF